MPLNDKTIIKIWIKYKKSFEEMEHYDRTREKLWAKKRINIMLNNRIINKLKSASVKTGKPISHIIEEAVRSI